MTRQPRHDVHEPAEGQEAAGQEIKKEGYLDLGRPLIHALQEECRSRGITIAELCSILDMSVGTWKAYVGGDRNPHSLARHRLERASNFLGISPLEAMMLLGTVRPEDFKRDQGPDEDVVHRAYRRLKQDNRLPVRVPDESQWDAWPQDAKALIAFFYDLHWSYMSNVRASMWKKTD